MCSSLQDRELQATRIAVSMRIPALVVTPKSVFDMKGGNHPQKQAVYARFSRVEMVELLARTNHPQKQAYMACFQGELSLLVFGSLVPGLEKDQDWTGLGPARTGNYRTTQDRNRSPVCGPLPFREFQDWSKTGLDWSRLVFDWSWNSRNGKEPQTGLRLRSCAVL